ncbi:MAG: NTP transferase domain-containing protein [Candidatus Sigynarchaeota archaeon]
MVPFRNSTRIQGVADLMVESQRIAAIIMAGGKGTRMGVKDKHKSTFEIAGKPAIIRLLENLRAAGVVHNVIVVGAFSDQVMGVVSKRFPDVAYVYQAMPRGTGNAAKAGLHYLQASGFAGDVLIVPGDAHVEPGAIERLIARYKADAPGMALLVKEKRFSPDSGRIVTGKDGAVVASIEYWDIMKAAVAKEIEGVIGSAREPVDIVQIIEATRQAMIRILKDEQRARKLFPEIAGIVFGGAAAVPRGQVTLEAIHRAIGPVPRAFRLRGELLDPEDIERTARHVNVSVYLARSALWYMYIDRILSDNAQNEEYLTDIVQIFSEHGHEILPVPLLRPEELLSFNNPEELVKINEYVASKERAVDHDREARGMIPGLRPVDDWIRAFEARDARVLARMEQIYGVGYTRINEKVAQYLAALAGFKEKFPEAAGAFIARAPGRVNLMGRHVDHRGGDVNMIAIDREVIVVAAPREDPVIVAYNHDHDVHKACVFDIGEIISSVEWSDWFGFITNERINAMVRDAGGDWSNYLKAAALRLQASMPTKTLHGASVYVHGDIPQAAGLSSSSALVVAMLECLINVNGVPLKPSEFIDLCGEGEWFVGTRGGSSDHAAIKLARPGHVTRMGFFPFEIKGSASFPPGIDLLVINSMRKAKKSGSELRQFNEKVLAYEIGFQILRERHPEHEARLHHLRDVSGENLHVLPRDVYRLLKAVSESIRLGDLNLYLHSETIQSLRKKFSSFDDDDDVISLREVLVYGIAECHRSRRFMDLLSSGSIGAIGQMMCVSHDGDRVVSFDDFSQGSQPRPFRLVFSEAFLDCLYDADTPIENVPGGYRCSIPEIDFIVDYMKTRPGVLGAQISGAGLGGCVMVLVEREHTRHVVDAFKDAHVSKWHVEPDVLVSRPILGSGIF